MAERDSPLNHPPNLPISHSHNPSSSSLTSPPSSRRKVRMFAHDMYSSSSDDDLPSHRPHDVSSPDDRQGEHAPGHSRSSSYPGGAAIARMPSASSSSKTNRPSLYSRSNTSPSGAAVAGPSNPKPRYRSDSISQRADPKLQRADSKVRRSDSKTQRSGSSNWRTRPTREEWMAGAMSRLDLDNDGYLRGVVVDDWTSDEADLDHAGGGAERNALVADAVRLASGKGADMLDEYGAAAGVSAVDLSRVGVGQPKSLILASPPPDAAGPGTAEGLERLEWQSMLASVLGGDILKTERTRIGVEVPTNDTVRKELGTRVWWGIRARLRNRTEEEEKRRVEQRRNRIVDPVLEEISTFSIKKDSGVSSIDQVAYILEKLAVVQSLYPHEHALRSDKSVYDSESFQARTSALTSWYTVVTQLQAHLHVLQKWTGTDDLDITRPNTTKEKALVKLKYHPLDSKGLAHAHNEMAADDSTFVDRILKEDSLQRTFGRRVFVHQVALIQSARQTVIAYSPIFAELGLPEFQYELERIISFPGRLIIEALNIRLSAAERLSDPDVMVIDDMTDSLRNSVSLAIAMRKQYDEVVAPDPEQRWNIAECFPSSYNTVIVNSIKMFFKLLHWKLKTNAKAAWETDVLEEEWGFLADAAEATEGVDLIVSESLMSLTNRLMMRLINYYETELHLPQADDAPKRSGKPPMLVPPDNSSHKRPMSTEEILQRFSKILDSIKMRYRKLQRFARRLQQRFQNSAEYMLDDQDTDLLIEQLHDSGHFLVYTNSYEEQGTYIFADGSLWGRHDDVHQLLFRSFAHQFPSGNVRRRAESIGRDHNEEEEEEQPEDQAQYLLLISPRQSFAWTGAVMTLEVDKPVDFALDDSRMRLIADGPTSRLSYCKAVFLSSFIDHDTDMVLLQPRCLVEQQAHLPKVNRELKKIMRSSNRLSECIIESAAHVRRKLRGEPGSQDLIENWYLFASDHGHRVAIHMDHLSWARFSRLLMRLAISWVSFICDDCDPTDRKTFRWTVNALEYAMLMTRGNNILHLNKQEFALLREKVASCMTLLISHFDILGARSSMEAKKEAERLEALHRMARLFERNDEDDVLLPRTASPSGIDKMRETLNRSLRVVHEDRLNLLSDLESQRAGLSTDQHLMGRVLDEEVSEDRALVFLAASTSNISLRWQQGSFIGGGANGSVYLGFNLDSGGIMAVKEIRVQDLTNSPALYKQIKEEADVMQMLSHENIVDYYGIEVHRDRVYIFEEYCPGGSLANLLEHGRVEDEDVIMVYAWQMLQGLQYLHSKGVEHRDVKPDNILLGANSVLKFVDFGAAKVIIRGNRTMAKTRAISKSRAATAQGSSPAPDAGPVVMNSLAGTPMYIAPEIIKGGSGRLGASDIWSMGCVVLEVTTGRKPWSNLDNEWAIMFHIGVATQHPPLPEPGQLSPLGIDFIEQCLTLDPQKRPTAAELLHHPWLQPMMEYSMPDTSPTSSSLPSTLIEGDTGYVQDSWSQVPTPSPMSPTPPAPGPLEQIPNRSFETATSGSTNIVTPGFAFPASSPLGVASNVISAEEATGASSGVEVGMDHAAGSELLESSAGAPMAGVPGQVDKGLEPGVDQKVDQQAAPALTVTEVQVG